MTISRKPKSPASVDVEALIRKGGTVAGQTAPESQGMAKPSAVVVRIPPAMLDGIERARARRAVRIPRHTWLLEAIAEKLARDQEPPPIGSEQADHRSGQPPSADPSPTRQRRRGIPRSSR